MLKAMGFEKKYKGNHLKLCSWDSFKFKGKTKGGFVDLCCVVFGWEKTLLPFTTTQTKDSCLSFRQPKEKKKKKKKEAEYKL